MKKTSVEKIHVNALIAFSCVFLLHNSAAEEGSGVCMGGPCLPPVKFAPSANNLVERAEQVEEEAKKWHQKLLEMQMGADNPCALEALKQADKAAACIQSHAAGAQYDIGGMRHYQELTKEAIRQYSENAMNSYLQCMQGRSPARESLKETLEIFAGIKWEELTGGPEVVLKKIGEFIKGKIREKIIPEPDFIGPSSKGRQLGEKIPAVKEVEIKLGCADDAIQNELNKQKYLVGQSDARDIDSQERQDNYELNERYEQCRKDFASAMQLYQQMMNDEACLDKIPLT